MNPSRRQDQITQSATDAAFGYFSATTAAYSHMYRESVRAWEDAVQADEPERPKKPKSWYRPPPPSMRAPSADTSYAVVNPFMPTQFGSTVASPAMLATFPGAAALMAAGVPKAVAWPLAEANSAAQDLTAQTVETVNEALEKTKPAASKAEDTKPSKAAAPSFKAGDTLSPTEVMWAWPMLMMSTWQELAKSAD